MEIECLKNGQPLPTESGKEKDEETVHENGLQVKEKEISDNEKREESEDESDEDEEDLKKRANEQKEKANDEAKKLAKTMMNKKAARLYGRMQHGINKKQEIVAELHRKREKIQVDKDNKSKTVDGKTILKAKVDHLKSERKTIEQDYEKAASTGSMKKKRRKNKN